MRGATGQPQESLPIRTGILLHRRAPLKSIVTVRQAGRHRSWKVLAVLCLAGCSGDEASTTGASSATVRLAIVGQALIEHDPREHLADPMGSVAPLLEAADAVFTNLEVAVAGPACSCTPTRDDVFFHGAGPHVLDYLASIGVSLLSLANNHSWDYGTEGILSTIAESDARGFIHAGTGSSVDEAAAPAFLDVEGVRIGLVAHASVNAPDRARATADRPGVNMLDPKSDEDWERNIGAVRRAAAESDVVIAYQHYQTDAPEGWQERWARATIDAGADIYVSHGEPSLSGVEIYDGALILYGLGNFIFHTRTELGRYTPDVWESVLVEVSLDANGLDEVLFTPIVLDPGTEGPVFLETRGFPKVATQQQGHEILTRLLELSRPYATRMEIDAGQARLRLGSIEQGS